MYSTVSELPIITLAERDMYESTPYCSYIPSTAASGERAQDKEFYKFVRYPKQRKHRGYGFAEHSGQTACAHEFHSHKYYGEIGKQPYREPHGFFDSRYEGVVKLDFARGAYGEDKTQYNGDNVYHLTNTLTAITASTLVNAVTMTVGSITSVTEPSPARIAMTVVGMSWSDVELSTTSITAFFLERIPLIALSPAGVAAPPAPMRFAAKFKVIASEVSSDSPGNSAFVSGFNNFLKNFCTPEASSIFIAESHSA